MSYKDTYYSLNGQLFPSFSLQSVHIANTCFPVLYLCVVRESKEEKKIDGSSSLLLGPID